MVKLMLLLAFALIAGAFAALWFAGAREPVYAIARAGPAWFVAVRGGELEGAGAVWSSNAEFVLIGAEEAYWTRFYLAAGAQPPRISEDAEDAFVARVVLMRPPRLVLGLLRALVWTGALSKPAETAFDDAQTMGYRADAMPSAQAIATLRARSQTYRPAMVNFLAYRGEAGRAAYARYGRVALRTVYRTGGTLLYYGRIVEVVRPAQAGPCVGAWDDVAAMRYALPGSILSMESVPEYRAALHHRDEGLDRTVVIASSPQEGP